MKTLVAMTHLSVRLVFPGVRRLTLPSVLLVLTTMAAGTALAQTSIGDPGTVVLSRTTAVYAVFISDTYIRAEVGVARSSADDAFWRPSGFPPDPQIFFDLSSDTGGFGGLAVGKELRNGLRGELALNVFGSTSFDGDWSFTVPPTPGPHASMSGTTRSVSLMGNVFYEPFGTIGAAGKIKPYVMAGLGVARNTMSDWTRINPDAGRSERTFEGDTTTSFAYALGVGLSMEAGKTALGAPITVEFGYRYFDLGKVKGRTTPLSGGGGGDPVTALNFNKSDHVVSVGIRIPLRGN